MSENAGISVGINSANSSLSSVVVTGDLVATVIGVIQVILRQTDLRLAETISSHHLPQN